MSVLAIYGAGGLGREMLELARIINRRHPLWDAFAWIDDGTVPNRICGCDVYSYETAKAQFGDALQIVMGVGEPATREKLFQRIAGDGIPTPTLIHPDVYIPESTQIGKGVVIQYGSFISCNVTVHDYVFIQPQCNIGHDDELEEGCVISGFGNLGGAVHVGKQTFLGLGATIRELIAIGDNAIVGMGAVVFKDIPDEMIAMGNPARVIGRNTQRRVFK